MEKIASLLEKSDEFTILCGAGISFESGIPFVSPFIDHFLDEIYQFEDSLKMRIQDVIKEQWQFEAFMEKALRAIPDYREGILSIFNNKKHFLPPSSKHLWIAEQVKKGKVKTIYTTNFDSLIEEALVQSIGSNNFEVLYHDDKTSPQSLALAKSKPNKVRVIKLHGCITDIESMVITMQSICQQQRLPSRDTAVESLFNHGTHDSILVLGYSVSDNFDITPKINSIDRCDKNIYFIDHNRDAKRAPVVTSLSERRRLDTWDVEKNHNPFKRIANSKSLWIHQHTDHALGSSDLSSPTFAFNWKSELSNVMKCVPPANKILTAAWLCLDIGLYDKAMELYDQITECVANNPNEHLLLGLSYEGMADIKSRQGQFSQSRDLYNKSQHEFEEGNLQFENATVLHNQARLHIELGEAQEAENFILRAIDCFEAINNQHGLTTAIATKATISILLRGDYTSAFEDFTTANEYFRKQGFIQNHIITELSLINYQIDFGDKKTILERLENTLILAQKYGVNSLIADVYNAHAEYYKSLEKYDTAIEYYNMAETIFINIGDLAKQLHTSCDIATLLKQKGLFKEAETRLLQCIAFEADHLKSVAYNNLGAFYLSQGEIENAYNHLQSALPYYKKNKDQSGLATVLGNLGMVANHLGNPSLAASHFSSSVVHAISSGKGDTIAHTFIHMGTHWGDMGFPDLAISHYEHAQVFAKSIQIEALINQRIGTALELKQEYTEATAYFETALSISQKYNLTIHKGDYEASLAMNLAVVGAHEKALDMATKALASVQLYNPSMHPEIFARLKEFNLTWRPPSLYGKFANRHKVI